MLRGDWYGAVKALCRFDSCRVQGRVTRLKGSFKEFNMKRKIDFHFLLPISMAVFVVALIVIAVISSSNQYQEVRQCVDTCIDQNGLEQAQNCNIKCGGNMYEDD